MIPWGEKKNQQPNTYYVAVLKVGGRGENKKKKKDLTEKACQSYYREFELLSALSHKNLHIQKKTKN